MKIILLDAEVYEINPKNQEYFTCSYTKQNTNETWDETFFLYLTKNLVPCIYMFSGTSDCIFSPK